MVDSYKFTSESVCAGHPDKICDQIADAIVDEVLKQDNYGRVAIETLVTCNLVVIAGEVSARARVDYEKVARREIKRLGYVEEVLNFSYRSPIKVFVHTQSPEIARGVKMKGAGDQGCIKAGSLVKTINGFQAIENIKRGTFVLTPAGYRKVLDKKETGIKDTIKLFFINGMILECTKDHRILCYRENGETYWKQAKDIKNKDYICIIKPQDSLENKENIKSIVDKSTFFTKYNHKIYGPTELQLNEEIGYITGVLIGDGCVTNKKYIEIAFGNERGYAIFVKKILDKYFPKQPRLIKGKNNYSLKIDSLAVRKHFENFGVLYKKSYEKTTPKDILTSPKKVIASYLSGLFDTDGTIVENTGRKKKNIRIRLSSSSYRLLQETQLLLSEFNIKSSILFNIKKGTKVGKDNKYKSKHDNYLLSLSGFESYINFCKKIDFRQQAKKIRAEKYLLNAKIKVKNSRSIYLIPHPYKKEFIGEERLNKKLDFSITQLVKKINSGKELVYDLQIDREHTFSANGIFVHNSMFGFSCRETKELMPMPITLAHSLAMRLDEVRVRRILPYLRPDGKTQVTVEYKNGKPTKVTSVILAAPHRESVKLNQVKHDLYLKVVKPVLKKFGFAIKEKDLVVNGTGVWHMSGPASDTGVTGRKIIVDTYGGYAKVGGGCFSGKDPTKVDRSGAYAARFLAKNIVAQKLADKVEVRLAYFIGAQRPIMQEIETFGTNRVSEKAIKDFAGKLLDTSVEGILEGLRLRQPIYLPTAVYGHFGRDGFPWEKIARL